MTDMNNDRTSTCLLCNSYLFDQKPHVSQEADGDGEYFTDFKRAFQLFCNLIKVVSNEGRGMRGHAFQNEGAFHCGEEELNGFAPELEHFRKGHPCCGDCNMALLNLLRCDKIIKEAELRKQELLKSLKMAIVDNQDTNMHKCQLDEVWLPVRSKLIQSLEAAEMNGTGGETGIQIAQAVTNDSDFCEYIDDDSLLQGPENDSFNPKYVLPDLQDPEIIVVDSSHHLRDPLEEEPPMKRRRRRDRTQKRAPGSKTVKNKDVKTSSIKTKPCSIPLTRIRVEDYPYLKIDLKIPRNGGQGARESFRKAPEASKTCQRKSNRPRESPYKNAFYHLINEDILLFQNTCIKFNPNGFTCLEPDCSHFVAGSDYFTFQAMRAHINECHGGVLEDNPRPCPLCEETFADGKSIRYHMLKQHAPTSGKLSRSSMVCESCWRTIKDTTCMRRHVWLHMSEAERTAVKSKYLYRDYFPTRNIEHREIFACKSCPKQFAKLVYLRTHEKTHVPKHLRPKFNCGDCESQFLDKKSLQDHIENKHRPELAPYPNLKCRICEREFNFRRVTAFRTHLRSHSKETPYICEQCGKTFISSRTLTVHTRSVHVTVRPYQCEYCEKSYKLSYVLRLHQRRVHKALLPQTDPEEKLKHTPMHYRPDVMGPVQMFPCEHCDDKVFEFRSRLKYHVKISHPEVFQSSWLT